MSRRKYIEKTVRQVRMLDHQLANGEIDRAHHDVWREALIAEMSHTPGINLAVGLFNLVVGLTVVILVVRFFVTALS